MVVGIVSLRDTQTVVIWCWYCIIERYTDSSDMVLVLYH